MSTDKPACVARVLDGLDPNILRRVASSMRDLAHRASESQARLAGVANVPTASWQGATRSSVEAECTAAARQVATGVGHLTAAAEALTGAVARLEGHQSTMLSLGQEWDRTVPNLFGRLGHDLWQNPLDAPGSVRTTMNGDDLTGAQQQELAVIARRMQIIESEVVATLTQLNTALQRCGMTTYGGAPASGSWGDMLRGGALEKDLPLAHGYRTAQEATWLAGQMAGLAPGVGVGDAGSTLDPQAAALWRARAGDPQFAIALAATPGGIVGLKKVQDSQNPPTGWSKGVNTWWNTLPPSEKDRLAALPVPADDCDTNKARLDQIDGSDIAALGGLGGIPTVVRDGANRRVLAASRPVLQAYRKDLEHQVAELGELPGGGGDPRAVAPKNELDRVCKLITGTEQLDKALARRPPQSYLLIYDNAGTGHAAVAYGNPDTAHHTVTYVPGLTSNLAGSDGDCARARALHDAAQQKASTRSVSSIYWLGYDAPQITPNSVLDPDSTVLSDSNAKQGALRLTAFTGGLDAAHDQHVPTHRTLLGHSYGSLVVGQAASHHQGLTDDIIAVGSPGMGVEHATELGVGAGHVYAGNNVYDPVPYAWKSPGDEKILVEGGTPQHTPDDLPRARFGPNTTSTSFGANVFPVDPTPGGSGIGDKFQPHSSYWSTKDHDGHAEPGASLDNMANIVIGRTPQTTTGEHR